jgi:hypothetical protein
MARAKRHYIPGYIWHLTHRCHKREFLLKFSKDRHRYLQWLYQARKRYGLTLLDFMVTSNHFTSTPTWSVPVLRSTRRCGLSLRSQGYQLREAAADYKPLLEDENEDIGLENAYYWDLNGG